MKAWRGQTEDGTFAAEFQASLLIAVDRYCRDAGSSETGGILVGRYSADLSLAIVQEASPPPSDSRRGHAWFVRGVCGLRDMLRVRWQAKERTHYIGEWHFHPASYVVPSSEDFEQMLEFSRDRNHECKEPLLLIFGSAQRHGQRVFRAFVCPAKDAPMELHPVVDPPANSAEEGRP